MNTSTLPAPNSPAASTVQRLDKYENALIQYLKQRVGCGGARLDDLRAIWAWRNAIEPRYIQLPHLAGCMYRLAERCGLLGASFASPCEFGGMGVIVDAAPDREWAHSLEYSAEYEKEDYWCRVIAVLAGRLTMAEVSKLPGYNHNAAAGPFRFDENGNMERVEC